MCTDVKNLISSNHFNASDGLFGYLHIISVMLVFDCKYCCTVTLKDICHIDSEVSYESMISFKAWLIVFIHVEIQNILKYKYNDMKQKHIAVWLCWSVYWTVGFRACMSFWYCCWNSNNEHQDRISDYHLLWIRR